MSNSRNWKYIELFEKEREGELRVYCPHCHLNILDEPHPDGEITPDGKLIVPAEPCRNALSATKCSSKSKV